MVPGAKRVFITSHAFAGNLKSASGAASGTDAADALCAQAVAAGGLGGTWRAWLSDSTHAALDRIVDVSPWYTLSRRTKLFDTKTGVGIVGTLQYGPNGDVMFDEYGHLAKTVMRWTGTTVIGTSYPNNCDDWTSATADADGDVGTSVAHSPEDWTVFMNAPCDTAAALYCFEQ
ncbi:MAG: hypothetical protein ABI551_02485 [Polyangiaceae bacterium]